MPAHVQSHMEKIFKKFKELPMLNPGFQEFMTSL